jgi:uncharacterized protein YcbK (DUF882 family)
MYYEWKKGSNYKLGRYFSTADFQCKCGYTDCVDQRISKELVDKLDAIRHCLGKPMTVTSAFRCSKKQNDIRNSGISTVVAKKSSHETGDAADTHCVDFKELGRMVEDNFDNIGYATEFYHVDMRPKKADGTKRKWNY